MSLIGIQVFGECPLIPLEELHVYPHPTVSLNDHVGFQLRKLFFCKAEWLGWHSCTGQQIAPSKKNRRGPEGCKRSKQLMYQYLQGKFLSIIANIRYTISSIYRSRSEFCEITNELLKMRVGKILF